MRAVLAAASVAAFLVACDGGSDNAMRLCTGANTTPASTDPDYAANFVGNWIGTVEITLAGQSDSEPASMKISRKSANKLAIGDSFEGTIGLVTSATTAGLSCMTGSDRASCGSFTMTFDPGTITLNNGGGLDLSWDVAASGCGQYLTGTATMSNAMKYSAVVAEGSASAPAPALEDVVRNAIDARFSR